jgi:predicted nucleic acid-binding protein
MKIDRYVAVLDSCVLAPMPIADTLLRLAEEPAFYTPRWSPDILHELDRTLIKKFGYTPLQVERRLNAMQNAFPDAVVDGYQDLIKAMKNNPKDRHVLAAAIKCGAHAIVSDNKKHFPPETLAPYGLECISADEFFESQYHLDPDSFIAALVNQALEIGWTLPQLISKHVPILSKLIVTRK